MEYEDLSVEPRHYPDCCLALSRRLIDALADSLLQKPAVTLSIGSGSGLLEATLLKRHEDHIDVRGVEVADLVHKHLPEQNTITVNGTWDLYPDAALATAWMFVYPREPRLLGRYIDTHGRGNLDRIIWLGPKMDWQDYEPVFLKSDFRSILVLPACGVADLGFLKFHAIAKELLPGPRFAPCQDNAQQSNRCLLSRLPAGLIFESPGQGEVIWDSPVTEQCIQPSSLASTASFSRRGDPPKDHPLPHISFDEVFVTDGANAQGNRVTTISTLCAAQATATHREEHKLVHNAPIHGSESAADSFAASQFAHSEPLSHSISVKAQRKNMPYFQGKGNKARRLEEKTATRPSQDIHDDYKSRLQRTLRLPRDARIAPEHLRSLVWFSKNTGTDEANSPGIPGSSRVLSTTQSNVAGYIGGKPSLDGPKSTSRRHSSSESMKPQVTFTEPQNHGTSHEEIRALRRIQAKAKLMGYNKGSLSMNESSESEVPHVHREEAATSSLISLADTMEATVQPNSPATREQPGWRPASSVYSRPVDGDSQSIRSQTYGKLDIILDDERESTATYGHLPLLLPRTYKYPDTNTRDSVDSEESQDTIEDERSLDKPPQAPIAPETDLEKQSVISPGAYGDMISTPVNDSPVQETLDPFGIQYLVETAGGEKH
ncbi:hypothetical protein M8818_003228 [Zalaria obscura]|uniref:Uncharacterized protein n=1 Tax=Zalaria obscura TaxID=2024903 RepID=A0ACC3SGA6_9PEZI